MPIQQDMARLATGPMSASAMRPRDRRGDLRQSLGAIGLLSEGLSGDRQFGDRQLEVSVLNVSPHGCAFRAPVTFRPGAVYTMRIGSGPLHLTSTLRVIASRDRADGFFDVGATFV